MDSKEEASVDGHRPNTATENFEGGDSTIALQKKRARRVSFAEMTSVHFFSRDEEENETPPNGMARNDEDSVPILGFGGQLEQGKESEDEDNIDHGDDDDDDAMDMRRSFLRPIGSPSPGGSSICSASSNDEDNFFGPVSTNFIKPGRFSDSAVSDDNHDVTMDSTAFSMHFQSLARSESGVDLRTPTGVKLYVDEKTPNDANTGHMILTFGRKPVPRSSIPVSDLTGGHDSNDMSLLAENPKKYDYDKLSPGLGAVLAETEKHLLSVSGPTDNFDSGSTGEMDNEVHPSIDVVDSPLNVSDHSRKKTGGFNSSNLLNREVFGACIGSDKTDRPATFGDGHSPDISSNALGAAAYNLANAKLNESPKQSSNIEFVEIPLAAPSSPVNKLQTVLNSCSPSKRFELSSPLVKEPLQFLRNEYSECNEGQTSIQKSISKLESLEKSAFSSAFKSKVDFPSIKSLDFSKSPNLNSALKKNHHSLRISSGEDPLTEEKFVSLYRSKGTTSDSSADVNKGDTLEHIIEENNFEERLGHEMNEKSPNDLSTRKLSTDQSKYRASTASPSRINWSNNLKRSLFPSKQAADDVIMIETAAVLAKTSSIGQSLSVISPKFFPSPGKHLENKTSSPPVLQYSQSKDFLLENQFERNADDEGSLISNPSITATKMDTVLVGMKSDVHCASIEVNHVRDVAEVKENGSKEVNIYNEKTTSGTMPYFVSPAKENKSQVTFSRNLGIDNQSTRGTSRSGERPGVELHIVVHDSVSSSAFTDFVGPQLQNLIEFPAVSPSKKPLGYKDSNIPSPKSSELSGKLEKFSARKRNMELLLSDQHRTETTLMHRSPKLQKADSSGIESVFYPNGDRKAGTGCARTQWIDVYSKFSEDMEHLISRSAEGLSSKMMDMLENMLICWQRSQVYEILRAGIMPQNATVLHDLQLERSAEAKQLLQKILFEKTKLQLKHVKRERLLKRLHLLDSKIRETQLLKTKISSQPLKTSASVQVRAVSFRSSLSNLKEGDEVSHKKLDALRHNMDSLNEKILDLKTTICTSCNMKSEQNSADTIALANEYLVKRAYCRSIRLDMQMWVVSGVCGKNGQHIVVLSYLDFIVQSIKLTVGSSPIQTTSYELNETLIEKTFPNMDAGTVFAFVFNVGSTYQYISAKTLAQETQVTSSLLGTLLDVLEEVQLAQLECRNLIQSRFCSESVGHLNLLLCFINYKTGRKVILMLDMSCLKRGVYPSEITPFELGSRGISRKFSAAGTIASEIWDAVMSVRSGYMRILRLCRCVLQVIQVSSNA